MTLLYHSLNSSSLRMGMRGPRKVADNMLPVSASLLFGETVAAEEAADVRDVHRRVAPRTHLLVGHRHRSPEWRGDRCPRGGRSRGTDGTGGGGRGWSSCFR